MQPQQRVRWLAWHWPWAALALVLGLVAAKLPALEAFMVLPERAAYPATDWVQWHDSPQGVVARHVLPPARQRNLLGKTPILENDLLLAIDYRSVLQARVVQQLSRQASPGTVFLYQIQRQTRPDAEAERLNVYVVSSYRPVWLFAESPLGWTLNFVGNMLLLVAGGLLVVLLLPFVRNNRREYGPVLACAGLLVALAALCLLRYGSVLADDRLQYQPAEQWLAQTWAWLGLALACLYVWLGMRTHPRPWVQAAPLWALCLAAGLLVGLAFARQSLSLTEEPLAWLLLAVQGLAALAFVQGLGPDELSRSQRRGRYALALVLVGQVAAALAALGLGWPAHNAAWGLGMLLMPIPLAVAAGPVLRLGNWRQVLQRSLLAALLLGLLWLWYATLGALLGSFAAGSLYRWLLEAALVGLMAIGLYAVFRRYRHRLLPLLASQADRRREELERFVARIPRYTHSSELLTDLQEHIHRHFDTEALALWPDDDAPVPPLAHEALTTAAIHLHHQGGYWSSSRELFRTPLPTLTAAALANLGWQLVWPIKLNEGKPGLLLVGRKRKGPFTLADHALLQRAVQQTQLSLEILRLLEKEKELVEKTLEANLTALRAQINPHFLFNTLNTIAALIHDAPAQAEQAVEKLAFIFRHTLKYSREAFVPLGTELQLVRAYLDIEQIRFGDRLRIVWEVDAGANDVPIPALVLQTLMENCIKHGIARVVHPGLIDLRVRIAQPFVEIHVYDNGPGIDLSRIRKGTGVKNVLDRLNDLYDRDDLIRFVNTGDGTRVELQIPIPVT